MTAETSLDGDVAVRVMERPLAMLVRLVADGLVGALALAAIVLCWRRLGGGLSHPLGLPALAAFAVIVATLAAAARSARRYQRAACDDYSWQKTKAAAVSVCVVATGLAVSLPGSSVAGLAVLWSVLAVEESWAWLPAARRRQFRIAVPAWRRRPVTCDAGSRPMKQHGQDGRATLLLLDPPATADVLQQLTRSRSAEGVETLSGWLRVPLAAGQRSTSVHVAFCPPFATTPKASLQQVDGPPARIKTVQLLPFGARFDVKLASVTEAATVLLLQFSARAEMPGER